jgi:hypothetical protein
MRRPMRQATLAAAVLARESLRDPTARTALAGVLTRLPQVLRLRTPLPASGDQGWR